MIRTVVALALVAVALCGCVLESRKPIYSDSQSVLALGASGGPVKMSSWRDGKWEDDGERPVITIVGQHYEATDDSSTVVLNFVALDGDWHVLQAIESDQLPVYMLAKVNAQTADVYTLDCTDLKRNASLSNWVEYEGDDCFIKPGAPGTDLFKALVKTTDHPSSRFEILN